MLSGPIMKMINRMQPAQPYPLQTLGRHIGGQIWNLRIETTGLNTRENANLFDFQWTEDEHAKLKTLVEGNSSRGALEGWGVQR